MRGRGRLLARRDQQLLAIQVQVLIRHEVVHCFVEGLVRAVGGVDHAILQLNLAHAGGGHVVVLLRHVVGVDLLGEAHVVAHGRLRVLLLLVRAELVLLPFRLLRALGRLVQGRGLADTAADAGVLYV